MAACQMYPDLLSEEIRNDPKRRAECAVYDALAEQLKDPKFAVYYSKDWLNQKFTNIGQEDGECDFIVAHPDLGLLFVEVKGGKVRREGQSGQWYSGRHKIKDPIRQARTSKHVVREAIHEQWGSKMPFIKTVHCAILPNSACNTKYLGEGLPLEIFAFEENLPKLGKKIYEFFHFEAVNDSRISGKFGNKGMVILQRIFAKDFDFSPKLKDRISRNTYLIEQLTEGQSNVTRSLKNIDKCLIEGPAGSGKTMLAVNLAESAAQIASTKGERVLLVCYNAPLAAFLRQTISDRFENLWIHSYHALCRQLVLEAGVLTESEIDSNFTQFCATSTERAWEAADRFEPMFSTIIVDEGQDFKQDWWDLIQALARDDSRTKLRVFRDNNQKIRWDGDANYDSLQGPISLDTVLRNTREIGLTSVSYYDGDTIRVEGPEGDSVQWKSTENEVRDVEKLVQRFLTYEGVRPEELAILTFQALDNSRFKDLSKIAGIPVARADSGTPDLVVDSVQRFKGLERNVIILCGLSATQPEESLMYVGVSRAKAYLAVVGPDSCIQAIKKYVEQSKEALGTTIFGNS